MMLQVPVPPTPPTPPFDPNLIFGSDMVPPVIFFIVLAALTAATIILWPIVRAFARRLEGKGSGDAALRAEVEQLHVRLAEVDSLHGRVAELEERVDFTERLLAQTHEGGAGAPGRRPVTGRRYRRAVPKILRGPVGQALAQRLRGTAPPTDADVWPKPTGSRRE